MSLPTMPMPRADAAEAALADEPSVSGAISVGALALDDGTTLAPVTLAYETWGTLAPTGDNAVLLCHALTGNAHARDTTSPNDPRAGWWNPLIGPGRLFDTTRYYVICSNVLGGCSGSSGPLTPHPRDGLPYGMRFPLVSVGDMVRAQRALLAHLGVWRLALVVGGSLGGQQALEWAIAYPELVERVAVIAGGMRLGALGIALDELGRRAILADPKWCGGRYTPGEGPDEGLALARMAALLSYTSADALEARFGRRPATRPPFAPGIGPTYDVETYLQYQGLKLVRRFDANSYLILTRAMDRYDAAEGPGRGSDEAALGRIRARLLAVGISSDWLFPPGQVRALAEGVRRAGGDARYAEIASAAGHDAFLKEWEQLDAILRPLLAVGDPPRAPP